MKRLFILGFLAVIFASNPAAAQNAPVGAEIKQTCDTNFEPVVSMEHPNKTFNNIGHPSYFDYKVCVRGLVESKIANDCQGAVAFYISSNNTDAHFSKVKGYNWEVCTGNVVTTLEDSSCNNGAVPLFSVSDKIQGFGRHIAGLHPGKRFSNTVCAYFSPPENVTVGLKFNLSSSDEVYFDDQKINGEFEDTSIAEYPYIIAQDGDTIAGLVMNDYISVKRSIGKYNKYEVKREIGEASYYLPFTRGDKDDLERTQEDFFDGTIRNGINPSFSFNMAGTPVVRAIAEQEVTIVSNLSVGSGSHSVEIEKTGDNRITIRER